MQSCAAIYIRWSFWVRTCCQFMPVLGMSKYLLHGSPHVHLAKRLSTDGIASHRTVGDTFTSQAMANPPTSLWFWILHLVPGACYYTVDKTWHSVWYDITTLLTTTVWQARWWSVICSSQMDWRRKHWETQTPNTVEQVLLLLNQIKVYYNILWS